MITVSELISQLQHLPPDSFVIVTEDREGFNHRPASGATDDDCYWLEEKSVLDEDPYRGGVPCVVIW